MTPTYVAKRVGDEYVLVRVDAEGIIQRAGLAGLGLGLVGFGMARKGLIGILACVSGSMLAYGAWTGRRFASKRTSPGGSASHRGGVAGEQKPQDEIDEAAMESFPASDPPAHSGGRR